MKISLKIACLLCLSTISSWGQTNNLLGKTTSKGKALPYANIYLKNTKYGTYSDLNGRFELKSIPNGTYTLITSSIGYKTISTKLSFSGNQNLTRNFNLTEDNLLSEVVISGTLNPVTKSSSPVPVEVYSKGFFKKKHYPIN